MTKKTITFAFAVAIMLCQYVFASDTVSENEVKAAIVKNSIEIGIEPALALSIAKSESKFRHNVRSPYGAVGVFQILPSTAQRMGYNPYYLSDNIKAGLMYYKRLYQMFGSTELALAAYNAGPCAVSKVGGVPAYSKNFVNSIMADYKHYKRNPDQSIIQAGRKAPKANKMIKPVNNFKPEVTTNPAGVSGGKNNGLTKHTLKMIDVSAQKTSKSVM